MVGKQKQSLKVVSTHMRDVYLSEYTPGNKVYSYTLVLEDGEKLIHFSPELRSFNGAVVTVGHGEDGYSVSLTIEYDEEIPS